jgi:hypothetical protein
MANTQLGTRQKMVFRGGTGAPPPRDKGSGRKPDPPQTGKAPVRRQPRKLIGSSDS